MKIMSSDDEKEKREIEVTLNTDKIEEIVRKNENLQKENQNYREKLLLLAQKKFEEKKKQYNCPSNIETPEELKVWVATHSEAERRADPIGKGGIGQLSLDQQSGRRNRTFNSQEELIDHLRQQADRKNEEGARAKAIIDEIWRKSLSGQKQLKRGAGKVEYKGKIKPSGTEQGLGEFLAQEFRKRRKQREEDEK